MLIKYPSVVIIAKNAEETIDECLDALQNFEEIILYLNESTDNTESIAQRYRNTRIIKGEFLGFGETKNIAASYSSSDWILSLDSDEVLDRRLVEEIKKQNYDRESRLFSLVRDNYFLGKKTISQDIIIRIYNKKFTQFNAKLVHEKVMLPEFSEVIKLKNSFKHHNITNINQTLSKMIKYTDLGSKDTKICFFFIVIFKAIFAFFQSYFLRFYFINGWRGFVISVTNANRRFYKYLKQYINCQKD